MMPVEEVRTLFWIAFFIYTFIGMFIGFAGAYLWFTREPNDDGEGNDNE